MLEFVGLVVLPGGGNCLVRGVGPPVAVVEVDHDGHAVVFGTFGHGEDVVGVTEALCGVDPYTKTYGVQAEFVH